MKQHSLPTQHYQHCTDHCALEQLKELSKWKKFKLDKYKTTPDTIPHCNVDTHADTSVAGPNYLLIELTEDKCGQSPFCKKFKIVKDILTANAATTYSDIDSREILIHLFQSSPLVQRLDVNESDQSKPDLRY